MIAECAVDPEVMAAWRYFSSLHADFGVGHGRLLCEFPRKWRRLVLQRAAQLELEGVNSARQAQRIIDQFQHGAFRRALVTSGREFPTGVEWCEAARCAEKAFDLIIRCGEGRDEREVGCEDLVKTEPPFARPRQTEVPRRADDLIACGWACFKRAREIVVVDPYFRPRDGRFGRVMGHFVARLEREAQQPRRLELHTRIPGEYQPSVQQANWEHWAREHLPRTWKLKVYHWEELAAGGTLHARYILTEIGGLDYNWGIDEDRRGQTQVSLLDDAFWEILYQRFSWDSFNPPQAFRDHPDRIIEVPG